MDFLFQTCGSIAVDSGVAKGVAVGWSAPGGTFMGAAIWTLPGATKLFETASYFLCTD